MKKIVLLEDDSVMLSSIKLQLKVLLKEDYELKTFKHLEKAVSYLENNACDIVISDLNLIDSQGQETIDKLVKNSSKYNLIIISGSYEQLTAYTHESGNYQFIPKDMDFNESISSAIQEMYG